MFELIIISICASIALAIALPLASIIDNYYRREEHTYAKPKESNKTDTTMYENIIIHDDGIIEIFNYKVL